MLMFTRYNVYRLHLSFNILAPLYLTTAEAKCHWLCRYSDINYSIENCDLIVAQNEKSGDKSPSNAHNVCTRNSPQCFRKRSHRHTHRFRGCRFYQPQERNSAAQCARVYNLYGMNVSSRTTAAYYKSK